MTRASDDTLMDVQALERLIENARGAMGRADPQLSDLDFRTALLLATARVIARHAPPVEDLDRQAALYAGILRDALLRERRIAETSARIDAYDGPEVA